MLVLHDDLPDTAPPDQLDAIEQAETVREALAAAGHAVEVAPFTLDPALLLARAPDLVFNLVESVGGDGRLAHLPPALFEALGIPFTGSGSAATALTCHKILAKRLLAAIGAAVPEDFPRGGPRWIVKSLWEHASVGLDDSCIVGRDAVMATIERCKAGMGGSVVAETYIEGRELNVSLIEEGGEVVVLPLAEIAFDLPPGMERIVGYRAKWDPDSVESIGTSRTFDVDGIDIEKIQSLCKRIFRAFRLRGYVRIDLRLPVEGEPVALEINTNPCLAPDAGFAAAVARSGRTLQGVIQEIAHSACR